MRNARPDDRAMELTEVAGLVARGLTVAEAARIVGLDVNGEALPRTTTFIPTPAEIEKSTARIRANWSAAEHRKRLGVRDDHWEPSEYFLSDL